MGPFLISLFAALGAGAWAYSYLQQRTGYGNSKNAILGGGLVAVGVFIIFYLTMRLFQL